MYATRRCWERVPGIRVRLLVRCHVCYLEVRWEGHLGPVHTTSLASAVLCLLLEAAARGDLAYEFACL